MHPILRQLLKMMGIDPDHPEQMLDAMCSSLGISPQELRDMPTKLVNICASIDKRLEQMQAQLDRLEKANNVGPDYPAAVDTAKLGSAINRATHV